ncbi:MAG: phosphoribosylglycinamide formyltransferase [Proteobacteria bacterium]|nr:phosphoribosylglycinamide formyltransferase [Pseudomonadota bacterium]
MLKIAVLASGGGTNLQAIIDETEAGRLDCSIEVVVTDSPSAFALERAKKHSIATAIVEKSAYPKRKAFDAELVRLLKEHGVEVVVLAGFMRLLSSVMLEAFPMRILNIHPSLLPSFPGLNVQQQAIEHGVKFSGCTVHFVDEGLDSGPILLQAAVPVLDTDTPESLAARILIEEHRIYPEALNIIAAGRISIEGRRVIIKEA